MAYDYNEYMRKYHKENLVTVTVVLSKAEDADIIEKIDNDNKSGSLKELMRKGLNNG